MTDLENTYLNDRDIYDRTLGLFLRLDEGLDLAVGVFAEGELADTNVTDAGLKELAGLKNLSKNVPRIDRVSARAKAVDRFVQKAYVDVVRQGPNMSAGAIMRIDVNSHVFPALV